eukprot:TRINITY_DN1692_c0_g1_i1.p1 TRINITY_DN1692_c0_g1~~TRINITY_DN1692_c0_g1_i1.p1  ORF type:complete len:279 (-),score=73.12 TRINITY_DN1692_c0_g1_i1:596-1432(-)
MSSPFFPVAQVIEAPEVQDAEENEEKSVEHHERFVRQLAKTRLCSFYAQRMCKNGASCSFAHGLQELTTKPDLRKTSICKDWERGVCPHSSVRCNFAHGFHEIRASEGFAPDSSTAGGRSSRRQRENARKQRRLAAQALAKQEDDELDSVEVTSTTSTTASPKLSFLATPTSSLGSPGGALVSKTAAQAPSPPLSTQASTQSLPAAPGDCRKVSPLDTFLFAIVAGTEKGDEKQVCALGVNGSTQKVDVPNTIAVIVASSPEYYAELLRRAMPPCYKE